MFVGRHTVDVKCLSSHIMKTRVKIIKKLGTDQKDFRMVHESLDKIYLNNIKQHICIFESDQGYLIPTTC